MSIMFPLRLFHPSLLIPWSEIEVKTGKIFLGFYDAAWFRIGIAEPVRCRISGKLVNRVRDAAGASWPLHQIEQMESQTDL